MPLHLATLSRLIAAQSHSEIARRAGLTRANLYRIARGEVDPRLSTVERIAAALDCSVTILLTQPRRALVAVSRRG